MGTFAGLLVLLFSVGVVGYIQLSDRLDESIGALEASLAGVEDPNRETGFESSFIYDRNGNQLWEIFGQGRRQRVTLEEIPDSVMWATVSVEDDDFYNNPGFDVQSNVRAVWQYFDEGQVVSGASTITQQLVRNVVFDPEYRREVSIERKLEEIALATVLTQRMSKDDILELYLNTIYYGNLAYGIESAAQTYFGKPAAELEIHEAALLAGLPQLPAVVDPLNPDPAIQSRVISRQHLVLDLMVEEGYITAAEADAAKQRTLNFVSPEVPLEAPHFTLYAMEELEDLLIEMGRSPELIADGGLRVYTTVDLAYQDVALRAAERNVAALRAPHNLTNAAVVIIHPQSAEIIAMLGSVDYNDASIDGQVNVTTALRQPGSTLKPFTYAAMVEQGFSSGTVFWDVETDFPIAGQPTYTPMNYDRRYHGPMRMRDALANSYNVPAVLALDQVGVDYLIQYLQRMGTQSLSSEPGRYGLSLTLGGGEITLLELTSNYATLARQGVYLPPTSILCVLDNNDNIIYEYENRCPEGERNGFTRSEFVRGTPVMDPRIAFLVGDMLADNAARTPAMGANSPLNTGQLLTSVKTGTTDNFRDNWTVGYTSDLVVGVWSGNSDNAEMVDISGLQGAAPIWNDIITDVYRRFDMPPSVFSPPQGITQLRVCNVRAMRDPQTGDCSLMSEWFLDGPPLVPDGNGNLVPLGGGNAGGAPPPPSEFGPRIIEREPGIFEVIVRPLPGPQAQLLSASGLGVYGTPRYCMVPVEVLDVVPDARQQLFIAPPSNPNHQPGAYRWAQNNGRPILPQFPCTADTLASFNVPPGTVGQIVSPAPGQTVSGIIPIYGVVNVPPGSPFNFYKVEVRGGPFPNWTTMGDLHYNQMPEPGVLETFYAEALPPGPYELRLWVEGASPAEQSVVSINLTPP